MKSVLLRRASAAGVIVVAFGMSAAAMAQYVWMDENGVRQYSDRPPPASIPASRIVKQPGSYTPPAPAAAEAAQKASAVAASAPMTTAEKNADFQRRRAEQAEKEKKAADEAKLAADRKKNCERARDYQRLLDSGARITRTGTNGEREFLTDEQRAQESRDARQALEGCK
jgi:hypothetical protein